MSLRKIHSVRSRWKGINKWFPFCFSPFNLAWDSFELLFSNWTSKYVICEWNGPLFFQGNWIPFFHLPFPSRKIKMVLELSFSGWFDKVGTSVSWKRLVWRWHSEQGSQACPLQLSQPRQPAWRAFWFHCVCTWNTKGISTPQPWARAGG